MPEKNIHNMPACTCQAMYI